MWKEDVAKATKEIEAFLGREESLDSRIENAAAKAQQVHQAALAPSNEKTEPIR